MDKTSRPGVVEQGSGLGDREGGLDYGANISQVSRVDGTRRSTMAQRVYLKIKEDVADALIRMLAIVHSALTLSLDNGREFHGLACVSSETGAAVYCVSPYASWHRGPNENTNPTAGFISFSQRGSICLPFKGKKLKTECLS